MTGRRVGVCAAGLVSVRRVLPRLRRFLPRAARTLWHDIRMGARSTTKSLHAAWLVSDLAAVEELRAQVAALRRESLMCTLDVGPEEFDELVGDETDALAYLDELVGLLERKLRPGLVREVVRRPAEAFGGRSMLEAIRDGELKRVLATVRASFQWDQSA